MKQLSLHVNYGRKVWGIAAQHCRHNLILTANCATSLSINSASTRKSIHSNTSVLDEAQKRFDIYDFLQKIAPAVLRADNPSGYVINAIKKTLSEKHSVIFQDDHILIIDNILDSLDVSKSV